MRYIRAFFTALRMTLRGETYVRPYEPLWAWIEAGVTYVDTALRILDDPALAQTKLRVEGREMTVQAMIGGVSHHFKQEYPYLLRHLTQHSITGIYATNMNDQFYIARLLEHDFVPAKDRSALVRLSEHLNTIPPSDSLE